MALDGANRGRAEAEKNIKRFQMQAQELQRVLEEEQRAKDEAREQFQVSTSVIKKTADPLFALELLMWVFDTSAL